MNYSIYWSGGEYYTELQSGEVNIHHSAGHHHWGELL